jgi:hypothetical protein
MKRLPIVMVVVLLVSGGASARELAAHYVIPAVANTRGDAGSEWHTDLTLHNPQVAELPIVIQFLPSNRDNRDGVPSVTIPLGPWETVNLWDVLGPDGFDVQGGTGALLLYPDLDPAQCPGTSCDFAVTSRTYTLNPQGAGEFGQGIPGFPAALGLDWSVLAYFPQVFDTAEFRTNVGLASWTGATVTVRVDVQRADGTIVDSSDHAVPPYGHVQWRMKGAVEGGTAVAYVVGGPGDAIVYPYASVANWSTSDPTYVEAQLSPVGFSLQAAAARPARANPPRLPVETFRLNEPGRHRR